ncbi:MAG: tetratricopeptide repeat protein [Pirellulales bacterium]|nr:tetratricopeptide repeat protein [Pirellulales bacterium]
MIPLHLHLSIQLTFLLFTFIVGGCASSQDQMMIVRADRNLVKATKLMKKGVDLMEKEKYGQAISTFEAAVAADVFSGQARNNLGVALFSQGRLYDAAQQFEHAARLMPDQHEPHHNLALVLEAVGRYDESVDAMQSALDLAPRNLEIMGGLARVKHRRGDRDQQLRNLLTKLRFADTDSRWPPWARAMLATLPTSDGSATAQP